MNRFLGFQNWLNGILAAVVKYCEVLSHLQIEEFMQDHDTIHQSLHKRPRLQPSPKPASPRSRSPNVSLSGSSNKSLTRYTNIFLASLAQ